MAELREKLDRLERDGATKAGLDKNSYELRQRIDEVDDEGRAAMASLADSIKAFKIKVSVYFVMVIVFFLSIDFWWHFR